MVPDPTTAFIDPFHSHKVLHLTCFIHVPNEKNGYDRCPRSLAVRATEYLKSTGIADTVMTGPEAEFFMFDNVDYKVDKNECRYFIDGEEGYWNTGSQKNLAHRAEPKQSYFPVSPIDRDFNIRSEMLLTMKKVGIPIEKHHHEVATLQHELGFKYLPLLESADAIQVYKYVIKNVAKNNNKTVTFMPKPIFGDNGSGMHVHHSLWKDGKPLFYEEGNYCNLSDIALYYIGGILHHAPSLLAFTNPTTNSYKRLVPGFEAPVNLVYSKGNRSAAIRIPIHQNDNPKSKRIEFRCPDPSANPYIAFSAILMAGIDGIINKISPGQPLDKDVYELSLEEKQNIRTTPGSLAESLSALEKDHQYLLKGNVFSKDFIDSYIELKRQEIKRIETIPHPVEFSMYYHC